MRWTTTDPRSAGLAGRTTEVINYVSGSAFETLVKVGAADTDWAAVEAVIPPAPMTQCPTTSTDPRSAGRAGAVDEIVLYYAAGAGTYLIKYGAGNTDWVALPVAMQLEATGVTPGSYTNTNLTVDAYGRLTAAANGSSGSGGLISGSPGTQGNLVFDGASTVFGLVPSANVYTLTEDILADDMTVNASVYINTAGYRIFVKGTLTNNGTIRNNGSDGQSGQWVPPSPVGGAGGAGAPGAVFGAGGAGAAGTNGGNGSSATATTLQMRLYPYSTSTSSLGGGVGAAGTAGNVRGRGGGGGGAGFIYSGGNAGGITLTAASLGSADLFSIGRGQPVIVDSNGSLRWIVSTGGGGGGGSANVQGGGGGGGGGVVFASAATLAGSGAYEAKGGAGGTGTPSAGGSTVVDGGGGGGGGGGGLIVLIGTNTGTWTTNVTGGLAGGAGVGSSSSGGAGGAGADGVAIHVEP